MLSSPARAARALLLRAILFMPLIAACSGFRAVMPHRPTPTAAPTLRLLTPGATRQTVAPAPLTSATSTLTISPTRSLTATATSTGPGFALREERAIGSYIVRLWQPTPGTGLYNHATISGPGQSETRIESVAAFGDLPADDVTGDGFPDVTFETQAGGHRCCDGTVVYSLGPTLEKVVDIISSPDYYGTGRGTFQDLDGDGVYEFITRDALTGIPCTAPTVKVILQYRPGEGYVGASPRFASAYLDDIAAHTRRAEEEIELSRDGYKCGVYEVIVDYLYVGQRDRAWQELQRLYLGPDVEQFQARLEQAVSGGRFFVAATIPEP